MPVGRGRQRALLALLLLHANETLSTDRIVDELWRGEAPETALTALHGHVSHLRRVLEPGRAPGAEPALLVTRAPGYVLTVGPERLDRDRFRRLAEEGREALARGDAATASARLAAALGLWRGAPLADLEDEPFVRDAAAHLAEQRLAAVEDRVEADLALGRHGALVPELADATREHPFRERLHGQLMLALYRSGRQAEALDAFRRARTVLVEELGIEPGPALRELHERILRQDAQLAAPPSLELPPPVEASGRRAPRWALAAVTGVAVAAAVAGAVVGSGGHAGRTVAIAPDSLVSVDPGTGRVRADVRVGATPTSVSVDRGTVWVLNADDQTISRVDAATRAVRTFATGATPTDLAAGAGALWVGDHSRVAGAQYVGPTATGLVRVDPDSGAVVARARLPRPSRGISNATDNHVAVGAGAVWAIAPDGTVARLDPRDGATTARAREVDAVAVTTGARQVWVLQSDGSIARLDSRTAHVTRLVTVAGGSLSAIAVGGGSVWVTDPAEGTLWRVRVEPRIVQRTIPLSPGVTGVAYGAGAVWVVNSLAGTLQRINPATNRVTATVRLGGTPRQVAVGAGSVWATVGGAAVPATPAGLQVRGTAGSPCGRVYSGGSGAPDRVIASDLPLHMGPRAPSLQMSEAVAYVLRRHGFRAGRFQVGYRSCDDSTAQSGIFDPAKCTASAEAFAADLRVVGVMGPYNSDCAAIEIPIAARAPGGGLAMLSPTSTLPDLTRSGPGTEPGILRRLYPRGVRNFARLGVADDIQAAAAALFARRLGTRRAFVVDDGPVGGGGALAVDFRRSARRAGLTVAGSVRWAPHGRGHAALAARVAASHADVVYLAGLLDTGGGEVLAALRRRLGPHIPIVASAGFLPITLLFRHAGSAARGTYVVPELLGTDRFGAAGRRFVRGFGATQPRNRVDPAAVYAAQATEVLLQAIAHSDGTRASVTRELVPGFFPGGPLGGVRLDRRGDPAPAAIEVVRAERPGGADMIGGTQGARVVRVIEPPPRLYR